MSRVYLPTAEQMDETLENLSKIAGAMGTKIDTSTWRGVRDAVKAGIAPQLFPIGTQFKVSHRVYGEHLYDVVAHDYFKSVDDENAHTMTLMCHDITTRLQFDNSEAFYYAESELPAGTYNFTLERDFSLWGAGTYQFTLTQALPVGGHLCIDGYADEVMTSKSVVAYESSGSTVATEMVAITLGSDGMSLGTFGVELNNAHRVSYGSNNYKESAIRQFLNSPAGRILVWTPQTKFDRPPNWINSIAGFMDGLDADFLSVVGEVIVPCSANDTFESQDSTVIKGTKYTVNDKFYLASMKEISGSIDNTVEDDTVLFPYYEGAISTDYIKYDNKTPIGWWLRSANRWGAGTVRTMANNSVIGSPEAFYVNGCVPVCTIV